MKVQTFLEELEQQTGRNTKTVHNESGNGNTNKLSMDSALVTFNRKVSFQIVHPGCTLTRIVTVTDKDTAEDCKSTLGERLREGRINENKDTSVRDTWQTQYSNEETFCEIGKYRLSAILTG